MAAFGGLQQERRRLGVVALDAEAVEVHERQIDLADGEALIGDRAEPAHGLAVVDGYAAALAVEQPERQLRHDLAGRRGLRVPPRGLAQIPLNPSPFSYSTPRLSCASA